MNRQIVALVGIGCLAMAALTCFGALVGDWALTRWQARQAAVDAGPGDARAPGGAPGATAALTTTAPAPLEGGIFVLPGGEPSTLDPALVGDVVSADYIYEIYSGLVTLSPALEVVPDLAERWAISPDGTVYTFTLRAGIVFHDGRPLEAEDVAFAIERACDPATQSRVAETYLGDIVGCAAKLAGEAAGVAGVATPDARTVAITIDAPKAYFLSKLTYPTSFVVDPDQVASDPAWQTHPNATGPFRLATYEPEGRIELARHPGYYGAVARLERVLFDLRPVSSLTMYENGEIDAAPVGVGDLDRVRDPLNPLSAEVVEGPGDLGLSYLGFNTRATPFDDVHVRRAFNLALDKRALAEVVLRGAVEPMDTILPPGMPGHTPGLGTLTFDPARARAELALSRYRDARAMPPITLQTSGEGGGDPISEAVADMIGETLGIPIAVEQTPWEVFQHEVDAGAYPLFTLGWSADYADPQDFLDVLFHSQSPLNHTGYASPEVDGWLEAARVERDQARRFALYRQAERRILDDAAWLPLYHGVETWLVAPYVHGFALPPIVVPRMAAVWLDARAMGEPQAP